MSKGTRKVTLTVEYVDGTTEVTQHPSRNAAEKTVENYMADGVMPFIRTTRIEKTEA